MNWLTHFAAAGDSLGSLLPSAMNPLPFKSASICGRAFPPNVTKTASCTSIVKWPADSFALFFGAAGISYLAAIGMKGRHRKLSLAVGLGLNIANLAFFKYYYFVLGNLSKMTEVPQALASLEVVLPIGISFYTFQLMAYLIDVYRGGLVVRPERNR